MTLHQQIFSLIGGLIIFILILNLIRLRRLREEYAWIWLLAGFIIFLGVVWYELLLFLVFLTGAKTPTNALFILSIIFLILINLFFSIKMSKLADEVKILAQELTLLKEKLKGSNKDDKK